MCRSKQSSIVQLLNAFRIAVDSGKVLCPISESVFLELLRQQDLNTRRTTAELIDELSYGVTLVPYEQRVAQELVGVFTKFTNGSAEYHEVQELVWSKLGYVLGVVHPASTTFEPDDELAVQKTFFDRIWQFSLVEILRFLEESETRYNDSFESTADLLNELNRHHQSEVRNFKQVYIDESQGVLDLFMHVPRLWLDELETDFPCVVIANVDDAITWVKKRVGG